MVTKYFIKKGFVYKDSKSSDNGFDLLRWLKKTLTKLNITFFDPCCDQSANIFPVRWNAGLGYLEYYDGSDWTQAV